MRFLMAALMMMATVATAHAQMPGQYRTETDARRGCGSDPVVWANLDTKVLHGPASKFYGHTKNGAFVCQMAATRAGMHMDKTEH